MTRKTGTTPIVAAVARTAGARQAAICPVALMGLLFDGAWVEARIEHLLDRVGDLA
ncbi:hypothetical protein [Halodurantibacterium flavum]|uniref:Uncharacterized protein n=1 Tax=Halodurantibacterium flavum TaxID=1382802 RepID=A0ABW4S2W6_9RHOB